jgi:hypothetical protein
MRPDEIVKEATERILGATKPLTRGELATIMGLVYNAGYDDGRERGYEMALVDQALAEDEF